MAEGPFLGPWRSRTMGAVVSLAFDAATDSLTSLSLGSYAPAGHFEGPKVTLQNMMSDTMIPAAVKNLAYVEVSTMCRSLNGIIVIGGTGALYIWDVLRDPTVDRKSVSFCISRRKVQNSRDAMVKLQFLRLIWHRRGSMLARPSFLAS